MFHDWNRDEYPGKFNDQVPDENRLINVVSPRDEWYGDKSVPRLRRIQGLYGLQFQWRWWQLVHVIRRKKDKDGREEKRKGSGREEKRKYVWLVSWTQLVTHPINLRHVIITLRWKNVESRWVTITSPSLPSLSLSQGVSLNKKSRSLDTHWHKTWCLVRRVVIQLSHTASLKIQVDVTEM